MFSFDQDLLGRRLLTTFRCCDFPISSGQGQATMCFKSDLEDAIGFQPSSDGIQCDWTKTSNSAVTRRQSKGYEVLGWERSAFIKAKADEWSDKGGRS